MVNQYSISSDGSSKRIPFVEFKGVSDYDDPVDRSQFRPDSEQTRMFRLTGTGSSSTPLYDDDDSLPTDLEVDIRSGKLDKAEISQIEKAKAKELKESASKLKSEKIASEKKAINEARQDFLDKATGFKGSNQSETV